MQVNSNLETRILKKIRELSTEQVIQLEQFIDSLQDRDVDSQLVAAAQKLSESSFNEIWDNSEDAEYDEL